MAIFTLLFQNLDFLLTTHDDTECVFFWCLVVHKASQNQKTMPLDKEPTFEKHGRICLYKNNIEDTKRVSMKFIPTAAFFY